MLERDPIYEAVDVGEVAGGADTSLISKSQVSNAAFESAMETSLDIIGALNSAGAAPFLINAELQQVSQPNLQINFTTSARIAYKVVAADSGKVMYERTISNRYRAKFLDSIVREERIRLSLEGAVRNNIGKFIRGFVAHAKLNPTMYRQQLDGS